jgi:hypothetical protein
MIHPSIIMDRPSVFIVFLLLKIVSKAWDRSSVANFVTSKGNYGTAVIKLRSNVLTYDLKLAIYVHKNQ